MRFKPAIFVGLPGWLLLLFYLFSEHSKYGSGLLNHLINPPDAASFFFHLLIFTAPIGSTLTAYMMKERIKLVDDTKQSKKKLSHIIHEWTETLDAMPYGVMLTDRNFNILRANRYMAKLAGLSPKEVPSKKCYEIIHNSHGPLTRCPLLKATETRSSSMEEFYDKKRNKYFMTSVTPFFDEESGETEYAHSIIDITELKLKEDKLSKSKDAFFNMLKDIDTAYKDLQGVHNSLIMAFSNTIDAKSRWTKGHSERVTEYAIMIAREMELNETEIKTLRTATLLHDIGKIGTYDAILDKPDSLTKEEYEMVKKHTIHGEEILRPIKGLEPILPVIRAHHERVDGKGYPDGLKGDKIPLLAKIVSVADTYDSMTADRPYRRSPGREYAISELKRCSGTQFDSDVVDAFLLGLENDGHYTKNASKTDLHDASPDGEKKIIREPLNNNMPLGE